MLPTGMCRGLHYVCRRLGWAKKAWERRQSGKVTAAAFKPAVAQCHDGHAAPAVFFILFFASGRYPPEELVALGKHGETKCFLTTE